MPRVLDENGEVVLDPRYPRDVQQSDESFRRWEMAVAVAQAITREPIDSPETSMFARTLYSDPELATDEPTDVQEAGVFEREHPRGRHGQFIDKHHFVIPVKGLGHGPKSPGTVLEKIRELGLDKDPLPGPLARRLLRGYRDTQQMYVVDRSHGPYDHPIYPPYRKGRRRRHDLIVGQTLAGVPDDPAKPLTGVAAVLGREHPITLKLMRGGRLSEVEKETIREAADESRGGGPPQAIYMAGGSASGKSTLLNNNPELLPSDSLRIDPDKIKEKLPEYPKLVAARDHYASLAVHEESGDIAARVDIEASALHLDLVMDGTGNSSAGKFEEKLERQRDAGYEVSVMYVNAPTDSAIAQSVVRAEREGRWVPIPVIRQIHANVSRNFNHVISNMKWLKALNVFDSDVGHIGTMINGEIVDLDEARMDAFRAKEFEMPEGP